MSVTFVLLPSLTSSIISSLISPLVISFISSLVSRWPSTKIRYIKFLHIDLSLSLYRIKISLIRTRIKSHAYPICSFPCSPTRTMNIRLHIIGRLALNHKINMREIQPSSCNICSYDTLQHPWFEFTICALSFELRDVAMKPLVFYSLSLELSW